MAAIEKPVPAPYPLSDRRSPSAKGQPALVVHPARGAAKNAKVILIPFEPRHALHIARWASGDDLRWLAPNTPPPLTASKVLSWKKENGEALVLATANDLTPFGYGELNLMRNRENCFWLGHIVVRPDLRRRGIGALLLRGLVARAFDHHRAERVSLIVFPDNEAAIRCYRRSGFVKTGDEFHQFLTSREVHRLCRMEISREAWREHAHRKRPGQ